MATNKHRLNSEVPEYHDRDKWLNDLQRHFSTDLERKSEIFYNSNPHIDGCSSESEGDASYHPGTRVNGSFYTPCSGAAPSAERRASTNDRLDDLYRVVKVHSQQLNLLQNQIKSLVKVLQCSCKTGVRDVLEKNIEQHLGNSLLSVLPGRISDVDPSSASINVHSDSEEVPKCVFNPNLIASTDESERNFFSTVMGTLRGMLVESDVDTSRPKSEEVQEYDLDSDSTDNTMLNATLEQLKRLGVSILDKVPAQKKVTFCETARTESSVEIDSLAQKYLAEKENSQKDVFDQIQTMQKKTTDLSLATMKYLQRYKLSKNSKKTEERRNHRQPRRSCPDSSEIDQPAPPERRKKSPVTGKILDSVAIRSQPKLSPKKQWLLDRD